MEHRRTRIRKLERWLERFNTANPYMEFFHIGTSQIEVAKARQELKILKQQREVNDE
tara:strand:- start:1144 stop:1314 length:171 start_codon:yes stop_codon:yes gene_type:complete